MLLAPALKASPREIAERLGEALQARLGDRRRPRRGRRPGLPERVPGRRLARRRARRTCWRPATPGAAAAPRAPERIADRVRVRQPDRSADRRQRPPRRLRRRAGAAARVPRPRGRPRVLLQRRRLAADQARPRRSRPAPAARRRRRTATRASTWPSWRPSSRAPPSATRRSSRAEGGQILIGRIKATLERYRVEFDRWFSELSLHEGEPSAIEPRAGPREGGRAQLRVRGRRVAAHDHVRRRQGPRDRRARRRADLLRRRPGVPRGQARPRLRPPDHAARRRPPRLRRADEGGDGGGRRGPGAHRDPAAPVRARRRARRARVDVQAARRLRDARRAARRDRRRRHALLHAPALARLDDRPRPRSRARAESSENPVYYVQYAHARIASVLRKAGDERVAEALEASRATGSSSHPAERELVKKLLAFPAEVAEAAERRAPHRIAVVRARAGADLHGVLPRLPGRRRRAARRRVVPDRPLAWPRSARSPARSTCSASPRPRRCRATAR